MTQRMRAHASVECMSAVLYVILPACYREATGVSAVHCGRICFESRLKNRPS